MNTNEKSKLTNINRIEIFKDAIRKLTVDEELSNDEKTYLLTCAILFIKEFENNNNNRGYLEFAYYIILKYSITYNDYMPLYDFSINFGYYPISNIILKNNLVEIESVCDFLQTNHIENYRGDKFVYTKEQKNTKSNLIEDKSNNISYIAPTSYGKSSVIEELIISNNDKKIGIIVPTKSLLNQTYKNIKKAKLNYKLIIYDEMYNDEEKFIAILTQERALKMLERKSFYFDVLYIDESHNMFDNDHRSVLLTRLIRKNKKINPKQKVIYLSPLISDSQNLCINEELINEHKIRYNVKEPEYYELNQNGEIYRYNRFVNNFYMLKEKSELCTYIKSFSSDKNFIFIRRPVKIEQFSKEFECKLEEIVIDEKVQEFIGMLSKYVNPEFYMLDFIKKGLIYLHGKLPDSIKAYIEHKYKELNQIKYVIANHVILEGVNLPIDKLFILTSDGVKKNDLINLIGRVNRLNVIFDEQKNNLNRLLPQVHFIDSKEYNGQRSVIENKMKELRSNIFEDEIKNPLLENYDIDKLGLSKIEKIKRKKRDNIIREYEDYVVNNDENSIKDILLEEGMNEYFGNIDNLVAEMKKIDSEDIPENIIDKINYVFLRDLSNITSENVKRLTEIETREFYKNFMQYSKSVLSDRIKRQFEYFKDIQYKKGSNEFYIGEAYGEVARVSTRYINGRKVYVDLSNKSDKELINLAVVKIKMEDDFVSYCINKFINVLYRMNLITEDEYNEIIYGTKDESKLELIKKGLSLNIVNKLEQDNQLRNIQHDENNNLYGNDLFVEYKNSLDDYLKFLIDMIL